MKIKDIKYVSTGKTRTDGRYPLRIGSEVEFYIEPTIGNVAYLKYVTDNQGNPKEGFLQTSIVTDIVYYNKATILTTLNSVYELER